MLKITSDRAYRDCDGRTRREFLSVGSLGLGTLALPGLLRARAHGAALTNRPAPDTSIVWVWLGGGPTHIETFDPKMTAPAEYRSITGEVKTTVPGVTLGGTFPKLARQMHRMAIVRSFTHKNSGHGGGTHWVMTGYDNRQVDNGGLPSRPSFGSIASRVRGANSASGMPTYVRLGGISNDGPTFLGASYSPFNPSGDSLRNLTLGVPRDRFDDRRSLLKGLDRLNRQVDQSGQLDGVDGFEKQAFNVLLGDAAGAFDLKREDPKVVARYGRGFGQKMLTARRLCEAGCGFVTLSYGGWDMHGNILSSMKRRSPELDHALATFIDDVYARGLDKKILLVVTGEFGRTPKINKNAGRDHWAPLSTLALAGGGLKMGQVIGESAAKVDVPKSRPVWPQDLMATIFHVMGIDRSVQFEDLSGRPVYMIEEGRPIEELI